MAYVVTEDCIRCKYTDCVEVCPVSCFREGANMLVIDPTECIDCGVCESQCPVGAIGSDRTPGFEKWAVLNAKCSLEWPRIRSMRAHLPDAGKFDRVPNKFNDHFSSEPGEGN